MKWQRIGRIFNVDKNSDWMWSHATLPIPILLEDDTYRIYFSTRDQNNRSHSSYVDIDLKNPLKILSIASSPVLEPGKLGHFDDSGVTISCYLPEKNLFYYMGWNLPKTVPFSNQIGITKLLKNSKLERIRNLPILGKSEEEPLSFGYPWVMKIGNQYRMWYDTIFEWKSNSTNGYRFELRSARSEDGINWTKDLKHLIELSPNEYAIARPCILKDNGIFKMWYSVNRDNLYHLSYAESNDGEVWTKKEELAGLYASGDGWESEEIAYPFVFDHKDERYMLYNGNKYGKTGFGIAKLLK